ncbi:MAG TPA: formate dehydrogenase accessory sulfurtransferase FdhD [Gaiellales bacterium]|nr:formate dehydrogenase accessory sulfurtransferase FdhD [Gaiellales bacterium]
MSAPARAGNVTRTRLTAVELGDGRRRTADALATEEPLEIRVDSPGMEQRRVAVTMRTPGHDFELAAGFLFTEGIVSAGTDVRSVRYCDVPREEQQYNVVTVDLRRAYDPELLQRNFYTTSSCGVCGKASLDSISVRCAPVADGPEVAESVVVALPDRLREAQRVFDRTGGLHAAGLFDTDGTLLELREDVGRHNAVDKLVGRALLAGELPLSERVLMVSGRLSFEIVQKAAVAGIPIVCAVSAPSSLAVDAGRRFGMTLVGFLRGSRFNIYTRAERITAA